MNICGWYKKKKDKVKKKYEKNLFRTVFRKKEKKHKNLLLLFIKDYCSIMNIET